VRKVAGPKRRLFTSVPKLQRYWSFATPLLLLYVIVVYCLALI
jgi:hypothetical protein